ncbi:hypothetical protein GCM10009837_08550 [Streptomyces durmitorensis]
MTESVGLRARTYSRMAGVHFRVRAEVRVGEGEVRAGGAARTEEALRVP